MTEKRDLRRWQSEALDRWTASGNRGIVSVVTGAGKTIFALACIERIAAVTTLIVVPTAALLDQWWEETAAFFGWRLDDVNIVSSANGVKKGTINLAVLNTAAKLAAKKTGLPPCFLILDECHRAASPIFSDVLKIETFASLGLSATPERQYDDGLNEILVPAVGPVIYEYDYSDARRDDVIVPFTLKNVVFDLEEECQKEYDKLTKAIGRSMKVEGPESEKTIALLLKRARVLSLSDRRIVLALKIVAAHSSNKILVFHEDIEACEVITKVLQANSIAARVYHSKLPLRERADGLVLYRSGAIRVLVTCRALDEGFNVPETEIGVIAASTATRRQRIQRLGRIVRPAAGKDGATIYTLVATGPEIARLKDEEEALEGVASVTWGSA